MRAWCYPTWATILQRHGHPTWRQADRPCWCCCLFHVIGALRRRGKLPQCHSAPRCSKTLRQCRPVPLPCACYCNGDNARACECGAVGIGMGVVLVRMRYRRVHGFPRAGKHASKRTYIQHRHVRIRHLACHGRQWVTLVKKSPSDAGWQVQASMHVMDLPHSRPQASSRSDATPEAGAFALCLSLCS